MARHSAAKIVLIVLTVLAFVVTAAFNALAATANGAGTLRSYFTSFDVTQVSN